MNPQTNRDKEEVISCYNKVKEEILYGFPFHWGDVETTRRTKVAHCGAKAELLAHELSYRGYKCRYVIGYDVGMLQEPLRPKFLDIHFWIEVWVDGGWLTLDPSPDSIAATGLGDTEPGTHLGTPKYVTRMDDIPPWYKDVYNDWSVLPYKVFVNSMIVVRRWKMKIVQKIKKPQSGAIHSTNIIQQRRHGVSSAN